MIRKINLFFFLVFIGVVSCKEREQITELNAAAKPNNTIAEMDNFFNDLGAPSFTVAVPTFTDVNGQKVSDQVFAKHNFYQTMFSCKKHKTPVWTAYMGKDTQIKGAVDDRAGSFKKDPLIKPDECKINEDNYRNSGFDRGHLAPSRDFSDFGDDAVNDSFLSSNIAPQLVKFNRGQWKKLEMAVRDWLALRGPLFIIDGPIYDGSMSFYQGKKGATWTILNDAATGFTKIQNIGADKIEIPDMFYKIIIDYNDPKNPQFIAFMMKNMEYVVGEDIEKSLTTIDRIENLTHLDFFPKMDPKVADAIEKAKATFWPRK